MTNLFKFFRYFFIAIITGLLLTACNNDSDYHVELTVENHYHSPITRIQLSTSDSRYSFGYIIDRDGLNITSTETILFKFSDEYGYNLIGTKSSDVTLYASGLGNSGFIYSGESSQFSLIKGKRTVVILLSDGTIAHPRMATGTFQIRIDEINASILQDIRDGYATIGLNLENRSLFGTPLGRNNTGNPGPNEDYESGIFGLGDDHWFSFYIYSTDDWKKFIGSETNWYDLAFRITGGANTGIQKILRSVQLDVNKLNTISYSSFTDY